MAQSDFSSSGEPRPLHAPATARNRAPILEVLARILPRAGLVLEVASGTGEHAAHFAAELAPLEWQPSDPDPALRASIDAHREASDAANLKPALDLDVREEAWPLGRAEAVVAINLLHIAPWAATEGLIAGAARILPTGGVFYLYGPFKRAGQPLAPSNAAFDESLRRQNPAWGLRDLEDVAALAEAAGFTLSEVIEMPANNISVVFTRS